MDQIIGPYMDQIIEFVPILLLSFMFWFSGHDVCGILAPQAGIEPASPPLEGGVLTTRPPGKSSCLPF